LVIIDELADIQPELSIRVWDNERVISEDELASLRAMIDAFGPLDPNLSFPIEIPELSLSVWDNEELQKVLMPMFEMATCPLMCLRCGVSMGNEVRDHDPMPDMCLRVHCEEVM